MLSTGHIEINLIWRIINNMLAWEDNNTKTQKNYFIHLISCTPCVYS